MCCNRNKILTENPDESKQSSLDGPKPISCGGLDYVFPQANEHDCYPADTYQLLIYFQEKVLPDSKTTMYHIFIELYFCDKYYAQEEIFHICGEEVNLYLAGVNR